ncbi:hypothetical protein [Specibacter sp. NPDC078692]|uniref:hypothetical protein n=1 Tax=Specibacter sp. NPDC078692 TaxID=3155818 RepID=UPI00341E2C2D
MTSFLHQQPGVRFFQNKEANGGGSTADTHQALGGSYVTTSAPRTRLAGSYVSGAAPRASRPGSYVTTNAELAGPAGSYTSSAKHA